jgi:hypothetical protein
MGALLLQQEGARFLRPSIWLFSFLTEITLSNGDKQMKNSFYIHTDGYAVIQVNSKTYGYQEILIDIEDLPEVSQHTWAVHKSGDV